MMDAALRTVLFGRGAATTPDPWGPELWVQENFEAATGVTLTAFDGAPPTISGGQLLFGDGSQDGSAEATALATLTPGTFRLNVASANQAGPYNVGVGAGGGFDMAGDIPTEIQDTFLTYPTTQVILIANNYVGQTLEHFSLKRLIASLGNTLFPNGDFSSSTGQTLANGASVSGGKLSMDGTGAGSVTATASETLTAGEYYFQFDYTDVTTDITGTATITIGGTAYDPPIVILSALGTYSGRLTTGASDQLIKFATGVGDIKKFDNFIVQRILPVP